MPDAEITGTSRVTCRLRLLAFVLLFIVPIGCLTIWPSLDLVVSGLFYRTGQGFFLADQPPLVALHLIAAKGSWALGILLALAAAYTAITRKNLFNISAKNWLFLLLALLIGPALIANVGLKDHWGRARPREIVAFGGTANFSPALFPQNTSRKNGSFVSGDAAFGFYLPSFAYVVPVSAGRKKIRRFFWISIACALLFSLARLMMGAHFLSDILCAGILMLTVSAALHATMFGRQTTFSFWKDQFSSH